MGLVTVKLEGIEVRQRGETLGVFERRVHAKGNAGHKGRERRNPVRGSLQIQITSTALPGVKPECIRSGCDGGFSIFRRGDAANLDPHPKRQAERSVLDVASVAEVAGR